MTSHILSRNDVKMSGQGVQPLAFVHGFGCERRMWRFVRPSLHNNALCCSMMLIPAFPILRLARADGDEPRMNSHQHAVPTIVTIL